MPFNSSGFAGFFHQSGEVVSYRASLDHEVSADLGSKFVVEGEDSLLEDGLQEDPHFGTGRAGEPWGGLTGAEAGDEGSDVGAEGGFRDVAH